MSSNIEKSTKESEVFVEEMKEHHGAERLPFCFQCGVCASSCPVARTTPRFNPREVIRHALMGDKENVLTTEAIWLCCSCYACQERCPQKVEIADLIFAFRNVALQRGILPRGYIEQASGFLNNGRIMSPASFTQKQRETLGLPPLPSTGIDALRKITAKTGFDRLFQKIREANP